MSNDSLSKISAGLDELARLRAGLAASPLAGLLNAPRSTPAVLDMLGKLKMKRERYSEWSKAFIDKLEKAKGKAEAEADKIPGLTKLQRAQIVNNAVASARERLRNEGQDAVAFKDRERIRAEIIEMARLLGEVKADFESSVGALMRQTLGSDDRRKFMADVATAGPLEIEGYLREAIKRGGSEGKALAAAVFARMDALAEQSPDVRSRITISKGEIADLLIGRECSAALQGIEEAQIIHDEIGIQAAEADGRQVAQTARDALRFRKHSFEQKYNPQPDEAA